LRVFKVKFFGTIHVKDELKKFKFTYGKSNRPIDVKITVDDEDVSAEGYLKVVLYTPFSGKDESELESQSINDPNTIYWLAVSDSEFERILERTIALKDTVNQIKTSTTTETQKAYLKLLQEELETNQKNELPRLLQAIFRNGVIIKNGGRIKPLNNTIEKTLQIMLKDVAKELYYEFIDVRLKDEDCAKILTWQPGTKIPNEYYKLDIISENTIKVSSKVPSTVLKEIERRRNYGLSRTGKDLIKEFEKPPFGWDPKIVRLAVATLFKAGKISVLWSNKEYLTPSPELFRVFSKVSEFNKATFDVLPEVDWRAASELISKIFGEIGGDTFEKTAEQVEKITTKWFGEVKNLEVRVKDNELPECIQKSVSEFLRDISEIVEADDPNARLRKFLEKEKSLMKNIKVIKELKKFDFDSYRKLRKFAENQAVLVEFSGKSERLENLIKTVSSDVVISRLEDAIADYGILLDEFKARYEKEHSAFTKSVRRAIEDVRNHEAFRSKPNEAKEVLAKLNELLCEEFNFDDNSLLCKNCKKTSNCFE